MLNVKKAWEYLEKEWKSTPKGEPHCMYGMPSYNDGIPYFWLSPCVFDLYLSHVISFETKTKMYTQLLKLKNKKHKPNASILAKICRELKKRS